MAVHTAIQTRRLHRKARTSSSGIPIATLAAAAVCAVCGKAYGNQKVVGSYRILGNSVSRSKKKVIIPQYRVYRKAEHLNVVESLYYLSQWAVRGYLKYRK